MLASMRVPRVLNLTKAQRRRLKANTLTIYRYVPIGSLLELFRTNQLPFMKLSAWDDPFEGYLIDLYCQVSARFDTEVVKSKFSFSCWSLASESDHLWRIYTPNKDGVRIGVKLKELLRAHPRVKAGAVEYPEQSEIKQRINAFRALSAKQSHLFFVKRFAFRAERELRLMVTSKDNDERAKAIVTLPFDTSLINGLRFDPRMDSELYECLKSYLAARYSFDRKIITQSLLYQPKRVFKPKASLQRPRHKSARR